MSTATPALLQKPQGHPTDDAPAMRRSIPPMAAQFTLAPGWPSDYLPLHLETRSHVSTKVMCVHLSRAEQTARIWACKENGPLRPVRVNGRLMWSVAGIRLALGEAK